LVERLGWTPEDRAFARRAVAYLSAQGIRQFIDVGSAISAADDVREMVPAESRVVYVDATQPLPADAVTVNSDLRKPIDVLANPAMRAAVDFREPVAYLLVGALDAVTDDERPVDIVAGYAAACVPGSYVVISHSPTRTPEQIEELFGDLTIIASGLTSGAATGIGGTGIGRKD
jgi:hypothetical protein